MRDLWFRLERCESGDHLSAPNLESFDSQRISNSGRDVITSVRASRCNARCGSGGVDSVRRRDLNAS